MTPIVAFTDLDDTLFQTAAKCRPNQNLRTAALSSSGEPLSFMTLGQQLLVDLLLKDAYLIAVTARTGASLSRVKLKFNHGAIVNAGGTILDPNGQVDQKWHDITAPKAKQSQALLTEALEMANCFIDHFALEAKARLIGDYGLNFYLSIRTLPGHGSELSDLEKELSEFFGPKAAVNLSGHNLTVRPAYLDKARAVEFFIENYLAFSPEEGLIIGLGDSLADLGFLNLCHYQLIPTNSQLAKFRAL
ncbi:MAG: hypothetical protein LBE31_10615 [Deltaproteobacteria bacterium]|nr:hypothetical protein [Deltaproteobacteria bacterium]